MQPIILWLLWRVSARAPFRDEVEPRKDWPRSLRLAAERVLWQPRRRLPRDSAGLQSLLLNSTGLGDLGNPGPPVVRGCQGQKQDPAASGRTKCPEDQSAVHLEWNVLEESFRSGLMQVCFWDSGNPGLYCRSPLSKDQGHLKFFTAKKTLQGLSGSLERRRGRPSIKSGFLSVSP
ncbi:unnamed protein product [Lota lota]